MLFLIFIFFNLMGIGKIPFKENISEKDVIFMKTLLMKDKSSICRF